MAIVAMYHLILHEKDPGTNLVISAIHSDDRIPLRMAPLIYISTILTHLVGGSAGREGAALQLGGSIGNAFGEYLGFREKEDRNIMIMCGMSAAFSALFGTPIAPLSFPWKSSASESCIMQPCFLARSPRSLRAPLPCMSLALHHRPMKSWNCQPLT